MPNRCSLLLRRFFHVTLICLLAPLAARAGDVATFSLNTPTILAAPGTSGSFEISFSSSFLTTSVTAFDLTLDATATTASGLSFTSVTMATTPDAYVFQGASSDAANNTPFSTLTSSTSFGFTDTDTNPAGVDSTFATFGLAEVSYSVAADATLGDYVLTLGGSVTQTGSVTVTMPPGTFTIVPEPGSAAWTGLGVATGLFCLARRRMA